MPAFAYSDGPPEQAGTGPTVKVGCACHGDGASSDRAVVSVSGVPIQYQNGSSYNLTITVEDAYTMAGEHGNTNAGFLMSSGGVGSFSWDSAAGIRPADGSGEEKTATTTSANISHTKMGDGSWTVVWTAPTTGDQVNFWVAGNSVDKSGSADSGDYWNVLSFPILSPGTVDNALTGEELEIRTYSVGNHTTLFVAEKTAEQIEAEAQVELAETAFTRGNLFFWSSLTVLIFAAVVQREIIERREGTRPVFLAAELGQPQAIKLGLVSLGLFVIGVYWKAGAAGAYLWATAFFCSVWAAYGVYRTYRAMATPPSVSDMM
jgi:hypothetical protein